VFDCDWVPFGVDDVGPDPMECPECGANWNRESCDPGCTYGEAGPHEQIVNPHLEA
jgi:hypothetical protein